MSIHEPATLLTDYLLALLRAVLSELQRRGCELHYLRTPQGNEVDFHAVDATLKRIPLNDQLTKGEKSPRN